jgi:hypothetical protein
LNWLDAIPTLEPGPVEFVVTDDYERALIELEADAEAREAFTNAVKAALAADFEGQTIGAPGLRMREFVSLRATRMADASRRGVARNPDEAPPVRRALALAAPDASTLTSPHGQQL